MSASWVRAADFDIDGYLAWLAAQPVRILPKKGEYELVRYWHEALVIVWLKPSRGRVTFGATGWNHFKTFMAGGRIAPVGPEPLPQPRRRVMLYTDASYHDTTNTGAWAAIAVWPDGQEKIFSGPLKSEILSSTEAEICAVANALHRMIRDRLVMPADQIVVALDNSSVVKYIQRKRCDAKGKSKQGTKLAYGHVEYLVKKYSLNISAEWIRGHQKIELADADPRIMFNRRVDKLANGHGRKLFLERRDAA